jgi:hypothetical protein
MLKKLFIIVATVGLAGFGVACGGSEPAVEEAPPMDEAVGDEMAEPMGEEAVEPMEEEAPAEEEGESTEEAAEM